MADQNAGEVGQDYRLLRIALEAAKLAVWEWDIAAGMVKWMASSKAADEPAVAEGSLADFLTQVHEDDRERVESAMRDAAEHFAAYALEFRLSRPDNTHSWTFGKAVPLRDAEGSVTRLVGLGMDVEDRRNAEEAASRQLNFLNVILETLTEGVVACNADGRLTLFNRALRETHGLPAAPIPTEEWSAHYDLFHADAETPMAMEEIPLFRALRGEYVRDVEMVVAPKDRPARTLLASGRAITEADGRVAGAVVALHDITDRKRAEAALSASEEQLRHGQKMEAVGRLAGGIAHDFNNMLTAIKSYSELLLEDLPPDSPHSPDVAEINRAADRAALLTRQLLAFSRRQLLQPQFVQLNDVAAEMRGMLDRLIGENITVAFALDPALRPIYADPSQIQQVLMNLVVNARDAMPDGGTLSVETSNVRLSEEDALRIPSARAGMYACVSVSDTGCGMDEATRSRIFEPFFTTKDAGKGTGLGLATVYGIVTQSGGHIVIRSELGEGTTFEIRLPHHEGAEEIAERRSPPLALTPTRAATILLVEDDEMVRTVALRVLRKRGYTLIPAANGREALQAAAAHQGKIDLILTDIVMPEMGGFELARRMKADRPELRVILLSGYIEDSVEQQEAVSSGIVLLEKPFTVAGLLRTVQQTLESDER